MADEKKPKVVPLHPLAPKAENIHRRRGIGEKRETADEVWRKGLAMFRCGDVSHAMLPKEPRSTGCGGPSSIHYRIFWPMYELTVRWPELVAKVMASNPDGPFFPTVNFKYGEFALVSNMYCCSQCDPAIARAIAKGAPSWACVERDEGPGDNPRPVSVLVDIGGKRTSTPSAVNVKEPVAPQEPLIKVAKKIPKGPSA